MSKTIHQFIRGTEFDFIGMNLLIFKEIKGDDVFFDTDKNIECTISIEVDKVNRWIRDKDLVPKKYSIISTSEHMNRRRWIWDGPYPRSVVEQLMKSYSRYVLNELLKYPHRIEHTNNYDKISYSKESILDLKKKL